MQESKHGSSMACVIPSIGRNECIARALPSVLCQDPPFSEVYIVDDSGRGAVAYALVEQRDGVSIIETKGGQGGPAARALAYERVNSDLVVFLDDDDEMLPGFTGAILGLGEENIKQTAVFVSAVEKVWTEGLIPSQHASSPLGLTQTKALSSDELARWLPSTSSGLALNKKLVPVLPVRPDFPSFNDVQIVRGVAREGGRGVYVAEAKVRFFQYFSRSRLTSDIAARVRNVARAQEIGLICEEREVDDILCGSLWSAVRSMAYSAGFFSALALGVGYLRSNVTIRRAVARRPKASVFQFVVCGWLSVVGLLSRWRGAGHDQAA